MCQDDVISLVALCYFSTTNPSIVLISFGYWVALSHPLAPYNSRYRNLNLEEPPGKWSIIRTIASQCLKVFRRIKNKMCASDLLKRKKQTSAKSTQRLAFMINLAFEAKNLISQSRKLHCCFSSSFDSCSGFCHSW